jgi:hypothetical protein
LTFPSFKRHVLDELNGDLALALLIDEEYDYTNRYWQHAKYRWVAPEFSDYGEAFDLAQAWLCQQHNVTAPDWRSMLRIKGIWQGGIRSADPQPSASSINPFCRWLLLHSLRQDGVLDRYDRFVITRSDFVWLCPHPPLAVLDREAIWVPNGEDYGGLCDRHLVVSRADVEDCLSVIEDIVVHPNEVYEATKCEPNYLLRNNERFHAHHLDRKGLLHKVKRFPYVMYLARPVKDDSPTWGRYPTWSWGRYDTAVGHYVKYDNEFRTACSYATIIRSRMDWLNGAWMQFVPTSNVSHPVSRLRRLRYTFVYILLALRRSGRVRRFVRFCQWKLTR